ncbi:(2Fe-2S)-binding protein [Pseudonocardia nematodicida]|uniref:(2Fe-2S)-binding protein n=1 Tax=Pseudonocardia nematodicida TaxID=1206997 RepID=A0ABV1KJM0_9PSEU
MTTSRSIRLTVDGITTDTGVDDDETLVDVLRDRLGSTAVRAGCRNGDCGTCTAVVDGTHLKTCLVPAARADGTTVGTLAGDGSGRWVAPLRRAFMQEYAFQCGFCLPGMILSAAALLDRDPHPDDAAIRDALSGNLCRCTGYVNAVRAVRAVRSVGAPVSGHD